MKLQNGLLLVAATAMAAFFINTASAQYQAVGSDGIAASPKVRQQINDQNQMKPTATTSPKSQSCCETVSLPQSCKSGCCAK